MCAVVCQKRVSQVHKKTALGGFARGSPDRRPTFEVESPETIDSLLLDSTNARRAKEQGPKYLDFSTLCTPYVKIPKVQQRSMALTQLWDLAAFLKSHTAADGRLPWHQLPTAAQDQAPPEGEDEKLRLESIDFHQV